MPFAVAITKRTPFQGREEEFSNVYQYGGPSPTDAEASDLVAFIVEQERPLFAAWVDFVSAFVYEIGGTPAENLPILREDLSGPGTSTSQDTIYMECALLVSARSTRPSSLGRPVWFRKWLHLGTIPGGAGSVEVLRGTAPLETAAQLALENFMEAVMTPTVNGIEYVMQATNGGTAQTPAVANAYIEHRQFPEGRKERA